MPLLIASATRGTMVQSPCFSSSNKVFVQHQQRNNRHDMRDDITVAVVTIRPSPCDLHSSGHGLSSFGGQLLSCARILGASGASLLFTSLLFS